MLVRWGIVCAALALAAPASAQQGWPDEPMIIGVGYDQCSAILAFPDNEVRQALVSQWALGYYSGLATAGAETDAVEYAGLNSALHRLLAANPDIRVTVNGGIIAWCETNPDAHLVEVASALIQEYIAEGEQ